MAQAKQTSFLFGAVAGAAMTAAAVLTPMAATAQEVTPASTSENTAWTEELRAFDKAAKEARVYAQDNYGVGILIHVGEDFPNAHFQTPEQFARAVVGMFEQHLATPAQAFLSPNPGTKNTGLTYHIGHLIHGAENGTEVKTVQEAIDTAPDVVEQLKLLKDIASLEVQKASLDNN
jgi:opacity protein-like surface antigen